MKAVKIEWIDSVASNHEWLLMDDVRNWKDVEPMLIYTYGVVVQEDEHYVVVAQSYGVEPEECCNLMSIPKGCIKSITDL